MAGAPAPQVLLEAIAADAGPTFITSPMPEAPTGTLAASIKGGFPPVVMTNELAGGKPPLGQDQNGFLFLLSSHTLWVECGQLYAYNSDLAAAIGGYLAGTVLGMADGTGMWLNLVNGNTSNPDANGANWVAMATYGHATINATGGTVNLTLAQYRRGVIFVQGILTSNLTLNFPLTEQEWLVINVTSGAFTTTAKTAAGGSVGVTVPQGGFSAPLGIYSVGDGNIYPTVAPLSVPIDQNPTPLTLVERTNAGYVLATYFNSSAGVDNLTAAQVITSIGDGYLRKNTLTNFESQLLLQGLGGQLVNGQVPYSVVQQWVSTFLANAALTGVPTAPTAGLGVSNAQIATTAFVVPGSSLAGGGPWYTKNPDGSVDMWGVAAYSGAGGTFVVNFPIAFPAQCQEVNANASIGGYQPGVQSVNVNSVTFNMTNLTGTPQNIWWRAKGR